MGREALNMQARFVAILALAVAALVLLPAGASAATIPVTSTADNLAEDDLCSLREAVQAANTNAAINLGGAGADCPGGQANPNIDTIQLASATYPINIAPDASPDDNADGDLDILMISGPVVLDGTGSGTTTIDGNVADRVLHFQQGLLGVSDTVQELTVTGGNLTSPLSGGGGILAVLGQSGFFLSRATVTGNTITNRSGGGVEVESTGATLPVIEDSSVSVNVSTGASTAVGGGGINIASGPLLINDSQVNDNDVTTPDDAVDGVALGGGGISVSGLGSLTVNRTTLDDNDVTTADPADFPVGGGINASSAGGNISVTESTLSDNDLAGGVARAGGGIHWNDTGANDFLSVTNATFDNNDAGVASQGGAISATDGQVLLEHITTGNDVATDGRGVYWSDNGDAGAFLNIKASILAEGGTEECGGPDALTSGGYNVEEGGANDCNFGATGDVLAPSGTIALLPLADNGGPTLTRALSSGSTAINRAPVGVGACDEDNDQRNAPRPETGGTACDSGAYERVTCLSTLVNRVGTDDPETITGTSGSDGILALGGADTIDAGDAFDQVCAGNGDDTLVGDDDGDTDQFLGEGGSDTYTLANVPNASYTLSLGSGTGLASGGALGTDLLNSIENGIGSGGNDTITGDNGVNIIDGAAGDDTLEGRAGDDTITGGPNSATPRDTVVFDEATNPINVDLTNGAPQNTGDGTDTITTTENVTGSAQNDTVKGTAGDNTINGLAGSDTVDYSGGAAVNVDLPSDAATGQGTDSLPNVENAVGSDNPDTLTGDGANNTFTGLLGADNITGGAATDTAVYTQIINASLATGQASGAEGTDTLSTTDIENLSGSGQADTLTGNDLVNALFGNGGPDTLSGGAGIDQLFGGAGNDGMFVRDGGPDTADCGPDTDNVEADAPGVDTLIACEAVAFPAGSNPIVEKPVSKPATKKCKKKRKKRAAPAAKKKKKCKKKKRKK
jgi:CSLREA domain-containing protein